MPALYLIYVLLKLVPVDIYIRFDGVGTYVDAFAGAAVRDDRRLNTNEIKTSSHLPASSVL